VIFCGSSEIIRVTKWRNASRTDRACKRWIWSSGRN